MLRWEATVDAAAQDTVEFSAVDAMRAAAEVRWLDEMFAAPAAEPEQHGESDVGEAA